MKKLLLLLIVLSSFAFPTIIDEYKTDVYFGNGILTEDEDAEINAGILEDAIIEKLGSLKSFNIGKVDYAYNRTVSKGWDLFESFYQVVNLQGFVDFVSFHQSSAVTHSRV